MLYVSSFYKLILQAMRQSLYEYIIAVLMINNYFFFQF